MFQGLKAKSDTILTSLIMSCGLVVSQTLPAETFFEEIHVIAEKRSESLQDLSQAVTVLNPKELDEKNIISFVDLSSIAPGLTIAKNEGFKTIVSIRGLGNEANQNLITNPSVSYHLDGVYIASPFAIQTDFLDLERIEVLRGPQGTLFGQNSTAGAINVISSAPSMDAVYGKADFPLVSLMRSEPVAPLICHWVTKLLYAHRFPIMGMMVSVRILYLDRILTMQIM